MGIAALGNIYWKTNTSAIGRPKWLTAFGNLAAMPGWLGVRFVQVSAADEGRKYEGEVMKPVHHLNEAFVILLVFCLLKFSLNLR